MKNKKVLYITFIKKNNAPGTGSELRPLKMLDALKDEYSEVRTVFGARNNKFERKEACRQVKAWLKTWQPDFCYIEPPSGPFFFRCDRKLLIDIHKKNIPIGLFYRDAYWLFEKELKEESSFNISEYIKKRLIYYMQLRDLIILKKACTVIYYPSMRMAKHLDKWLSGKRAEPLPPGCYIRKEEEDNEKTEICEAIYVGAASKKYGVPMLLQSCEILNKNGMELILNLVCPENSWEEIKNKYPELIVNKPWLRIFHLRNGEELDKLMRRSSFAIIPREQNEYYHFAFPVKLVDYLSYLLPIVTTNCHVSAEFVKQNGIGISTEDNAVDFAEALSIMAKDVESRAAFKVNCIKARENNLWRVRAAKLGEDLISN